MLHATQALTLFAEITDDLRPELERRLRMIKADPDGNELFRPGALPDTHFMRFVIIDDHPAAGICPLPALLAWETNHDGLPLDYLEAVARVTPSIDNVFACCTGYPGTADPIAWIAWVCARSKRAAAFYTAYRGVPRTQIINDRKVRDAIREVVDCERHTLVTLPPPDIQRRIAGRVRAAHPELDTTAQGDDELRWGLSLLLGGLVGLAVLPLAAVLFIPWYLLLRRHEVADAAASRATTAVRPVHDDKHLKDTEDQDGVAQNQLTHVIEVKPGWFRLFTMWIVLTVIDTAARVWYVRGNLGGITSIHFARWVILRDTRDGVTPRHRVVFFSNYDGSWESYLGEFIDRASSGLTGIWSNTVGFPRTANLLTQGSRDEEAFKQWTRDHQIPTQVWWTGIPDSTVQNVRDDIWIRRRLGRELGDEERAEWLRRL